METEIQEGLRLTMQDEEETTEELQEEQASAEENSTPEEQTEATEQEETSDEVTPETQEGEAEEVTVEAEVNEHGKPYYTDEEVMALTRDGKYIGGLDSSRIKPGTSLEVVYKAMQSEFTPKLQERSELRS